MAYPDGQHHEHWRFGPKIVIEQNSGIRRSEILLRKLIDTARILQASCESKAGGGKAEPL